MKLAQTQAGFDGACLVYGRTKARSYLGTPDPPGHAFVSTFTTDGTSLNIFAHYVSEHFGQVKYHQFPVSSAFLIASYDDFTKSRRLLRNLQDFAHQNAERLRDNLQRKWIENQRLNTAVSPVLQERHEVGSASLDQSGLRNAANATSSDV